MNMTEAERLRLFIESIGRGELPDHQTRIAGIVACTEKLQKLEARRGPKSRKRYAMDTPQFAVALEYANNRITYDAAWGSLAYLCACEKRTAEKHLADML